MMYTSLNHSRSSYGGSAILLYLFLFGATLLFLVGYQLSVQTVRTQEQLDKMRLDEAALFGARVLPFREDAEKEAKQIIKRMKVKGYKDLRARASADGTEITVELTRELAFPFLNMFAKAVEGQEVKYSHTSSRARVIPRDIVIFMDNSNYLGPSLDDSKYLGDLRRSGGYTRWRLVEEEPEDGPYKRARWEPSPYLSRLSKKVCREKGCEGRNAPFVVTQQCHNPTFTAFKEGVYVMYDYLISVESNRVGVLAGPGPNGGVQVVRPFGKLTTKLGKGGEAVLHTQPYESGMSELDCLYASEEAYFGEKSQEEGLQYWMNGRWAEDYTKTYDQDPEFLAGPHWRQYGYLGLAWNKEGVPTLGVYSRLPERERGPLEGLDMRDKPEKDKLDMSKVNSFVSARHVIWSRLRHPSRVADFGEIIDSVIDQLPPVEERQKLTQIFIILGEFPYLSVPGQGVRPLYYPDKSAERDPAVQQALVRSLQKLSAQAGEKEIWLHMVTVRHDGMAQNCTEATELGGQIECVAHFERYLDFENFLKRQDERFEHLSILPIRLADPDAFAYEASGLLPLMGKQIELF